MMCKGLVQKKKIVQRTVILYLYNYLNVLLITHVLAFASPTFDMRSFLHVIVSK